MVPYGVLRGARALVAAAAAALAAPTAWMLVLLAAGARRLRAPALPAPPAPRAIVLVPAHDEEAVLAATLAALERLDPPAAEVVVVADHCTDATVAIARDVGVTVLEREGGRRGKAAALGWALEQIAGRLPAADAVVVVDADCLASENLLQAIGARIAAGEAAVQVDYVVANPTAGPNAALRDAAFRLRNTLRLAGEDGLGLSAGLLGTGMAFTPRTLERVPWEATSIVEDAEHALALAAAGVRVAFAPEASVRSPMPGELADSADQQARWESGHVELLRTWGPRLAREGLARRDRIRLGALAGLLIPPQSLLLAAQLGVLAAALVLRARAGARCAAAGLAGQALFVLGGLWAVRAPRATYVALMQAPALVVQKIGIVASLRRGGTPETFVRTTRPVAPADGTEGG